MVRAAAAVLGKPLCDPIDLGGSERSAVLRCALPDGGTVVVKAYPQTEAGRRGCTAEASGLEFIAAAPAGAYCGYRRYSRPRGKLRTSARWWRHSRA